MDMPLVLRALSAHASSPVLVALATPDLSLLTAGPAASAGSDITPSPARLEDHLGAATVHTIASALAEGHREGQVGDHTWCRAEIDGLSLVVVTRATRPDTGTIDQTTSPAPDPVVASYEAALAIASELDPGTILQRLVDLARTVVPSRYAALGVNDDDGRITQFITSGLTDAERAAIGDLPVGRGLLSELIHHRAPLLVDDIASDPRAVGFPPGHPPMTTLLGVPILLGDHVLGNLYLTDRLDAPGFGPQDREILQILAAHAAAAIDRTRLYRQLQEHRAEAERQRDQLGVILDELPTGVVIRRLDGTNELVNHAARELVYGASPPPGAMPEDGPDYRLLQLDGSAIPSAQRPVNRALRGETVRNRQLVLVARDGTRIPILMQAAPLHDADGHVDRVVVVAQDVARLREAEQLKDDFLSLVSHEIRTPLTTIYGGAWMLANMGSQLEHDARHRFLDDIVTESERLDRMLDNLLTMTAITAGRFVANTEPLLVAPVVRAKVERAAGFAAGHRILTDLPADLPAAEGDPGLLSQALRNLIENAVKYSPPGADIQVAAHSDDHSVTISVTDQGEGLTADQIPHVFDRFYRADASGGVRGMGLGLYISRNLMEAQGGRIEVDSPGIGQGTSFRLILPIAREWHGQTTT